MGDLQEQMAQAGGAPMAGCGAPMAGRGAPMTAGRGWFATALYTVLRMMDYAVSMHG